MLSSNLVSQRLLKAGARMKQALRARAKFVAFMEDVRQGRGSAGAHLARVEMVVRSRPVSSAPAPDALAVATH